MTKRAQKAGLAPYSIFLGRTGEPVCYAPDGKSIYLYDGHQVGYFDGLIVYSTSGRLLGRLVDGWLLDQKGIPALQLEQSGDQRKAITFQIDDMRRGLSRILGRPGRTSPAVSAAAPARSGFSDESYFLQDG